jgi:tetratricopeptide (TPR) repeat protein
MATLSVHLGWKSQATAGPTALRAAEKAVALNNEDGWSHVALGYARLLIDNQPQEAIELLAMALKLNPNLAVAHYFTALAAAYTGDAAASFRHADLAEHFAPRDLLALGNAGVQDNVRATASFVAGHYRNGIAFAQKTIALSPRQTSAYRQLVLNHAFAGDREQAAAALSKVKTLAPDISLWLRQQGSRWSNRHDHQKYVDAFRLAGMK